MLLFVMKLLVWRKNFLKQKKKDGELPSFCVQNHIFSDWYGVTVLGIFLLWNFCAFYNPLATDQVQNNSQPLVLAPIYPSCVGPWGWDSSSIRLSNTALLAYLMSCLLVTPQSQKRRDERNCLSFHKYSICTILCKAQWVYIKYIHKQVMVCALWQHNTFQHQGRGTLLMQEREATVLILGSFTYCPLELHYSLGPRRTLFLWV